MDYVTGWAVAKLTKEEILKLVKAIKDRDAKKFIEGKEIEGEVTVKINKYDGSIDNSLFNTYIGNKDFDKLKGKMKIAEMYGFYCEDNSQKKEECKAKWFHYSLDKLSPTS